MDVMSNTLYYKGYSGKMGALGLIIPEKVRVEVDSYKGVDTEVLDLGARGAGGYPPTGGGLV